MEQRTENVQLNEGFKQVCVWPAVLIDGKIEEFVQFFVDNFGVTIQYLEEFVTPQSTGFDGRLLEGTGGRNDVLFAVKNEDVHKFAVPRLGYGIKWIEDALANDNECLYPARFAGYKCWEANPVPRLFELHEDAHVDDDYDYDLGN